MNTVTTINLAGTAFQVEDPGYEALKQYLDGAKASLEGNPDRDEIIADMERAIADKCRACLAAHKTVVGADDAAKIVADMGPVSGSGESAASGAAASARAPKRLYRIREGGMIAGVANGLAAYFDVDVVLFRIIFVVLLFATGGGFFFAYVLAWIFIPAAETADQRAAAYGAPRNAQEIIDRVKAEYARLEARMPGWKKQLEDAHDAHKDWRREREKMRAEQRAWKRRQREWRRHPGPGAVGELAGILVLSFFAWYGYHHFPNFHDFLDAGWGLFTRTVDAITEAAVNR
jgi:phage shock protein PspC (stress-responsive transcriptional regulator)